MYKSSNPALGNDVFAKSKSLSNSQEVMTLQGTINKSFILIALFSGTFMMSFEQTMSAIRSGSQAAGTGLLMGLLISTFILALVIIFKKTLAPFLAPIYALLEGALVGNISGYYEFRYGGIVGQAAMATISVFMVLLFLYKSKIIKPTENFKLGLAAATGGICILYLVQFVWSFFGGGFSFINGATPFGIGFSVVVVCIAALNLVIDFDFIENGVAKRAPKFMEWYSAFGLLITLVWLYLEILRLLSKLRSRN